MQIEKDFKELLELLNKHNVEYCIVGAYAVAFHGTPRFTKDMDILVKPDAANARKIIRALHDFGFESLKLKEEDFSQYGKIIQLGYAPVRVDIITSIDGCTFDEVWKTKKSGKYGDQKVLFIGLDALIKNKKASNRPQDKIDVKNLIRRMKKKA